MPSPFIQFSAIEPDAAVLCRAFPTQGRLNYSTVKFNEEAAARIASHYLTMLTSLGTKPEQKLLEVQLLSAAEQGALTKMSFGPMHPEYTTGKLFTEMFEEQAAARPDAVCLIYEGDTMTYQEVNDRCNALAHQLVEMGVTTGTPVGVMLDRSFDLIIAIVATMKVWWQHWCCGAAVNLAARVYAGLNCCRVLSGVLHGMVGAPLAIVCADCPTAAISLKVCVAVPPRHFASQQFYFCLPLGHCAQSIL